MKRVLMLLLAATTIVAADGNSWWKHVEFLADDALQGRDTGSPGHKRAVEYVAGEFKKSGLEPAGDSHKAFTQTVAFKTRMIDEARSSLALGRDGRTIPLTLGDDAYFRMAIDPAPAVNAPLVFVGHGLNIPEQGLNDLDGVDLKGAIAVYLATTPRSLPGALQAHFGSASERWQALRAAGAVGTISIALPRNVETPWSVTTANRLQPSMSLADPSLDEYAGQQVAIAMNPARANVLFEGSGQTFDGIVALENDGKPLPRFALPSRVSARTAVTRGNASEGKAAQRAPCGANEYVVVSAHRPVGVGAPVNGDAIYNGAMDNVGIAAILEIAADARGLRTAEAIDSVPAVTGKKRASRLRARIHRAVAQSSRRTRTCFCRSSR
jgi:hypothetical protein